jgi:LPS-assembly lipoprotein
MRADWKSRGTRALGRQVAAGHPAFIVALLCMATMLSACGFQLRGMAALPFETMYIETDGYSIFGNELRRAIQTGTLTKLVDRPDHAEVVLRIVGEQQERHILAISSGGRVREFELRYRVAYRLLDRASADIVPPGELFLRRDMTYDDTQLLAKESEEQLLFEDMKSDAVQQMLRRLTVIRRSS